VRRLTFRLSHLLYCPDAWALENLAGQRGERVDTGGNTLADALALALESDRPEALAPAEPFGLVSRHRFENIFHRRRFESLLESVELLAQERKLLFVLHPPTARRLERLGLRARLAANPRIELHPRYGFFAFAALLRRADFVVTDGGGIQEEASYLGLPCLLLRAATERREGLGANVVLSSYDPGVIRDFARGFARWRRPAALPAASPSDVIVASLRAQLRS